MKYTVSKTFGGYKIIDSEGTQIGDVYDGAGAMARAQEEADRLNNQEENEYTRGAGREGRSG